jgi:hypothetical protein
MRKSKNMISTNLISEEKSTPQKNESKINNIVLKKEEKEENNDIYETPLNSKNNEDISYSKIEMPISYQLTNGRCIRLRNSQRSKNLYDNISSIKIDSKSSNSSIMDNNIIIHKNEKTKSLSKDSLFSYGKKKYIYPMNFIKHHRKKLMKEEKIKEFIDEKKESYKKYNLMINPSYKYNKKFISSPIHKYLPYCKKNDEEYKKNLISYIRNESNSGAKTVSCIYADYVNNNNFVEEKDLIFYSLKKKRKIYSTKKVFAVEKNLFSYCLINGKNKVDYNHPNKFMFYFDNDIGFNFSWQSPLIIANGDDDVETDDEVLNMAEEKCMDDLIEGINSWNKSSRLCRNYLIQKKMNYKVVKTPIFHHNIDKKENIENRGNNNDDSIEMNNNISFGKKLK